MAKPIFLIGFMGSGKSTLGRRLAARLGYTFLDLDKFIEDRQQAIIPDLFAKYGENDFRKLESKALEEVSKLSDIVIATGGGAPCFFDNMEVMNQAGNTIYLQISPRQLASRLASSHTERPLIKGLEGDALLGFVATKLEQREVFYLKAHHCLTGDRLTVEDFLPFVS